MTSDPATLSINVTGSPPRPSLFSASSTPAQTSLNLLDLWTSTGTKLASATFTNTAASGWQMVNLTPPVTIAANTTYVASVPYDRRLATDNFFTATVTNGKLTTYSTTAAGGNGVYAYGGTSTAGLFPTNTFSAANYWADVAFRPQLVG